MAVLKHRGQGVLIVEDDFDILDAMALMLRSEGYRVATATNGEEALDHLRKSRRPCLILLDLMMPVMDGWEFRDQQMQSPALASIPVVIVSADGNVKEKAKALGVADYLEKPIDLGRLLKVVKRYC